jgi:hypothetical protein
MLAEGITVVADTYDETKRILLSRYGDKNRIIKAHLDYLENIQPIQCPTSDALNSVFIECHWRIQALRALGEDVNGYGRVIAPKYYAHSLMTYAAVGLSTRSGRASLKGTSSH